MKQPGTKLAVIVILLALIAVGCSATAPQSSAPLPTGTFRAIDASLHVEFLLEIKSDGTYNITAANQSAGGTYTLNQNQITVTSTICPAPKDTATYSWSFDGSKLVFTAIKEECNDRWRAFNAVYTKQ
jgi:hypothetical protein